MRKIFQFPFGSRVYNTYGPNSDFDFREVFVLPLEEYFSPGPRKTSSVRTEVFNGNSYSYYGWEMTHFLGLLFKSIPNAVEFNSSHINAFNAKKEYVEIGQDIIAFKDTVFCPNRYLKAQTGNLFNLRKQYLDNKEDVLTKKYVEAMRLIKRIKQVYNEEDFKIEFVPETEDENYVLSLKRSGVEFVKKRKSIEAEIAKYCKKDFVDDIDKSFAKEELSMAYLNEFCLGVLRKVYAF